MLLQAAFGEDGLVPDFLKRYGISTLLAEDVRGDFFEPCAGRRRSFPTPVFPRLLDFRFHRADYLVKTDQMVNKKFDFCKEITILFDSVENRIE
jgi:hypothetical protein